MGGLWIYLILISLGKFVMPFINKKSLRRSALKKAAEREADDLDRVGGPPQLNELQFNLIPPKDVTASN